MRREMDMVQTAHDQAESQADETKKHKDALAEKDKVITELKAQQRTDTDADNLDTGSSASGSSNRVTFGDLETITKSMARDPKGSIAKAKEALGDYYKEKR